MTEIIPTSFPVLMARWRRDGRRELGCIEGIEEEAHVKAAVGL